MSKKPQLTIVDSTKATSSSTPANLGKAGAKIWESIRSEYRIDDAGGSRCCCRFVSPQTGPTSAPRGFR
jgi:hypothetical protein